MKTTVDRRDNHVVLHCTGSADSAGSREVERAVQLLEEDGAVRWRWICRFFLDPKLRVCKPAASINHCNP
jgi:hypothetical protein